MDAQAAATPRGNPSEETETTAPAQIFLQPIAAPSVLGLFALSAGLWVLATRWAHWYGHGGISDFYIFPFIAFLGLAQFMAGMWAYRARDGVATALHGIWGAFFMAFGLSWLLAGVSRLGSLDHYYVEFGYWLVALAAITFSVAFAALAENLMISLTAFVLSIGTGVLAVGFLIDNTVLEKIGGWVLVATAVLAWYAASALMIAMATGRVTLPFITTGVRFHEPRVQVGYGEPGVVHGQ